MTQHTEAAMTRGLRECLQAITWAALGKIAGKEGDRDKLVDGKEHRVTIDVHAIVDGHEIKQFASGKLIVNHDQQRASTTGPKADHLIAYILGKLNEPTRAAILADLPREFERAGCLPACEDAAIAAAKRLRERLRNTETVTARGAVRCEYELGTAFPRCGEEA